MLLARYNNYTLFKEGKQMKVTMIGMGAVGAVVGKRLNEYSGCQLTCLATKERKLRYEKNGIFINGEKINFNFVEPENASPADLIIIATKNLQLYQVMEQIKTSVGSQTIILSLLNGIQSEMELCKAFGEEKVLYGYIVNLSSTNLDGKITCGHEGTIVFGENSNERTQRINLIEKLFNDAKVPCNIPEDIHLAQWKKFLLNVSCNTISGLCRAPYVAFKSEVTKNLVRQCSDEVIKIANAKGIKLTPQMTEENIEMVANLNPDGMTSMFQDMCAKRKTENDYFCGTVVRLGNELGIPTPVCQLLHDLVECSEILF